MAKGFIVMTALPPTQGHLALIEWAATMSRSLGLNQLIVLVDGRPGEPIPVYERITDLASAVAHRYGVYVTGWEKDMPNQPKEHHDFWGIWQSQLYKEFGTFDPDDVVFSSEDYGAPLARVLGCRHLRFTSNRALVNIQASHIRASPVTFWDYLLPSTARRYQKTITIFGADSTGKTTLTADLRECNPSVATHEWARTYLESIGSPTPTEEHMEMIVHGQRALESTAKTVDQVPFIFRDTDLLSTVGYYRLFTGKLPDITIDKADLYLLCSTEIPFVPDPLRYGGDKRETTDEYWWSLLKHYDCRWGPVTGTHRSIRFNRAQDHVDDLLASIPWVGYERKNNG